MNMRSKGLLLLSVLLFAILFSSPSTAFARGFLQAKEVVGVTTTQNLIESPDGGAAVWDHATLTVLINPNVYSSDSSEIVAGRRAIDHWEASIAWFSAQDWDGDGVPDYLWLGGISFTVYVYGVNESLLKGSPDIAITYYYKITPGYILGYASLSFKQVGEHYAIQSVDIVLGVKGLSTIGIENLVAHEFGHALGLEHSNKNGDLMYSSFDMKEEKKNVVPPSTLSLYALTISHGWLKTGIFSEYHGSLAITLPAYIPYKKAP